LKDNYKIVGVADMISPEKTYYSWKSDYNSHAPKSQLNMTIYKRVDTKSESIN
jgi:hypothetical protein